MIYCLNNNIYVAFFYKNTKNMFISMKFFIVGREKTDRNGEKILQNTVTIVASPPTFIHTQPEKLYRAVIQYSTCGSSSGAQ